MSMSMSMAPLAEALRAPLALQLLAAVLRRSQLVYCVFSITIIIIITIIINYYYH